MEKMTIIEMKAQCGLLEWMVINAVTRESEAKLIPKIPKDGKWELRFTMEGVELDVLKSFQELESNLDEHIKEKAKELINEKFNDLFYEVEEALDDYKDKLISKLGELTE